ncbi:MAG: thiolase domain-containing protein [Desulfurococcales archaeon]|nr:thiolase domain-containing protein [Desulfurococcales archaeon]
MKKAAIIGFGWYGFKPRIEELTFREMMFEAASRAYAEAGIDPRKDVDAFISCQEDYWEGIAITDEFAPEPIGAVLRPTFTVAGDGLQGIAQAVMLVNTGYFDVVVVESHAKPGDIKTLQEIYEIALDPIYTRPLKPGNPMFPAGLDAISYLTRSKVTREHLAIIAAKNKNLGLANPRANYAANITVDEILDAPPVIYPMTRYEIAGFTDAALVAVIASEDVAKRFTDTPVWIAGVGWNTETGTGAVYWHDWGYMPSARAAASMAYDMAGVKPSDIVFAEVEDGFSFMEPLFIEEAGLATDDELPGMIESGDLEPDGALPVNPSGGSLSVGVSLEATGLWRLLEAYLALKAGVDYAGDGPGLVMSWRGPPTYTSMAAILEV